MENYNLKQTYKDYMAAAYSPENIAKAGGKDAHAAIIKKFKQHERHLMYKQMLFDIPYNLILYIIPAVIICISYYFLIDKVSFLASIPLGVILIIGFVLFSIKEEIGYRRRHRR